MKNLSREFVGRTIRALLFIGLVVILCTAVSSAGLFLASRFGLTRSREQVPLTALSIEGEGSIELPQRGKMVEGEGWRLRNSRDIYTLTLDNAMIGDGSGQPAISISGDLIMELKKDSGNWISSDGNGIQIESGTLVIRGTGSLKIDAGGAAIAGSSMESPLPACRIEDGELEIIGYDFGITGVELELAGGTGIIEAKSETGTGICAGRLLAEPPLGSFTIRGNAGAVLLASPQPGTPGISIPDQVRILPQSAGIKTWGAARIKGLPGSSPDLLYNVKTIVSQDAVTNHPGAGDTYVGEPEITLIGK
ncbi:MAG: hypothetical protein LUE94_00740 [Clostridiales bacterium]|nr:hypothetical protein [Clostridiales bacterium]